MSLPAAVYTTDKTGRITYCNPAAVELWGASPEPGKDKWSDLCRLRYPDGSVMPLDDYPAQICLTRAEPLEIARRSSERPDGKRVPIIPYPAPLTDEQGEVVGVVSMTLDITERKQARVGPGRAQPCNLRSPERPHSSEASPTTPTRRNAISAGYAALHGFPDGTPRSMQ